MSVFQSPLSPAPLQPLSSSVPLAPEKTPDLKKKEKIFLQFFFFSLYFDVAISSCFHPSILTPSCCDGPRLRMGASWFSSLTSPPSSGPGSPSAPARYDPDMEDMVSVLMWECCEWDEAMDITDWARLLLTGSGRQTETHITVRLRPWMFFVIVIYFSFRGCQGHLSLSTAESPNL